MCDDEAFRRFFKQLVDSQEIPPEMAEELFRRIMRILFPETEEETFIEENKNGDH